MNWISLLGIDALVVRWRIALMESAIAAEDRIELARLEWRDQKRQLRTMLVLSILLVAAAMATLAVVSLACVVQFWDTPYRIVAVWSVAGAWLLLCVGTLLALLAVMRKVGNAFALTRRELAQDWRDIKEKL